MTATTETQAQAADPLIMTRTEGWRWRSEGRREALRRLVAAGEEYHAHHLAQRVWGVDTLDTRPWELWEEGHHYATITADSAEEALDEARDNVDRSNYPTEDADGNETGETLWIDVRVVCRLTGEEEMATVTCDAEEPECPEHAHHDWQAPHEIVGGIKENPGCWGHGGGVICHEVCMHCGAGRKTDTWAQRRDTGEQGLTSMSYEPAGTYEVPSAEHRAAVAAGLCERGARAAVAIIAAYRGEGYDTEGCPERAVEVAGFVAAARQAQYYPASDRAARLALRWAVATADGPDELRVASYVARVCS